MDHGRVAALNKSFSRVFQVHFSYNLLFLDIQYVIKLKEGLHLNNLL